MINTFHILDFFTIFTVMYFGSNNPNKYVLFGLCWLIIFIYMFSVRNDMHSVLDWLIELCAISLVIFLLCGCMTIVQITNLFYVKIIYVTILIIYSIYVNMNELFDLI